jgi:hypothetical protein
VKQPWSAHPTFPVGDLSTRAAVNLSASVTTVKVTGSRLCSSAVEHHLVKVGNAGSNPVRVAVGEGRCDARGLPLTRLILRGVTAAHLSLVQEVGFESWRRSACLYAAYGVAADWRGLAPSRTQHGAPKVRWGSGKPPAFSGRGTWVRVPHGLRVIPVRVRAKVAMRPVTCAVWVGCHPG